MDYQVTLSRRAREDLREIVRYIALDSPERAETFGRFLLSKTRGLARFPEMGRVVPEFGVAALREIVVRRYRVVYRVDAEQGRVEIVRYWHAARGWPYLGS